MEQILYKNPVKTLAKTVYNFWHKNFLIKNPGKPKGGIE